jgi:hypothetical protein
MKKILTLVTLLGAFMMGANAQRSIHLNVVTNIVSGDTIIIDSVNTVDYLVYHGFVNTGSAAGAVGDSIHWATPYGNYVYELQSTDIPFAQGDTIGYFVDTLGFTNGPATGTTSWCDSVWMTAGTGNTAITDPSAAAVCETVYILNRNGVTGIFTPGLNKVSFTLYPNPTSDAVSFSYNFTKASNVNVRIMDLTGRVLNTINMGRSNAGNQIMKVDVANLPAGTYMLEMITEDSRGVAKFTKN